MRNAIILLAALAMAGCNPSAAEDNPAGTEASATASTCPGAEKPLAATGLCQEQAEALLLKSGLMIPGAGPGCEWVVRETPFATDVLLYRTLRCGAGETAVEMQVGNHMSQLVYTAHADGGPATDANGDPLVLAQIFAGTPDGRSRALWEARDSVEGAAAQRCDMIPPYRSEGLPGDALIVDVKRSEADLKRDDATPECGPYGYNPAGGSIDFWRTHQGYAWFFTMGTDIWDVDPGSFTIVAKDEGGRWNRLPDPF